jgi:hypothetical protein
MKDRDSILLENIYFNNVSNPYAKNLILEADWDGKFSDVQKVCYTADSVADALNKELERLKSPTKDRKKADPTFARISKGNIPTDEEGKANIEQFKKQIMQRPKTIFDKGEKSLHTTDEGVMTINTGIPALRAVIFDEENDKFFVITTCPGAAECIKNCYALQGFYIMNDGKNLKLINRLQLMINHPEDYETLAFMETERFAFEAKQSDKRLEIRWNDAGDFYSDTYFKIALSVTKKLKEKGYNVKSYAYTKVGKYVELGEQEGMTMTFSQGASPKEKKAAGDLSKIKTSVTVPFDVTKEFFVSKSGKRFEKEETTGKTKFKSPEDKIKLKEKLVEFYNTHPNPDFKNARGTFSVDRMKYTDELPSKIGDKLSYDAIVLPSGDSDAPAQRSDVRFIFLLEH